MQPSLTCLVAVAAFIPSESSWSPCSLFTALFVLFIAVPCRPSPSALSPVLGSQLEQPLILPHVSTGSYRVQHPACPWHTYSKSPAHPSPLYNFRLSEASSALPVASSPPLPASLVSSGSPEPTAHQSFQSLVLLSAFFLLSLPLAGPAPSLMTPSSASALGKNLTRERTGFTFSS